MGSARMHRPKYNCGACKRPVVFRVVLAFEKIHFLSFCLMRVLQYIQNNAFLVRKLVLSEDMILEVEPSQQLGGLLGTTGLVCFCRNNQRHER